MQQREYSNANLGKQPFLSDPGLAAAMHETHKSSL